MSDDRRVEYQPVDGLVPAPLNPKRHRVDVLQESIDRFGFVEPVVVDERTGRLVAGHGRAEAVAALRSAGGSVPPGVRVNEGVWLMPVLRGWSSADDAEAEAYLLASNRTSEIGGWDDTELAALLEQLGADQLPGVGFSTADVDLLVASLADLGATDPAAEWGGMPEFQNSDLSSAASVTVHFPSEAEADRFFASVLHRPRTRSFWWPAGDGHRGSDQTVSIVAE